MGLQLNTEGVFQVNSVLGGIKNVLQEIFELTFSFRCSLSCSEASVSVALMPTVHQIGDQFRVFSQTL